MLLKHLMTLLKPSASLQSCAFVRRCSKLQTVADLSVGNKGILCVRRFANCELHVKTIDPVSYPYQDRAFVAIRGDDVLVNHTVDSSKLNIRVDQQTKGNQGNGFCEISVPLNYDVSITAVGSQPVNVSGFENSYTKIDAEHSCYLEKLKSQTMQVRCQSGSVRSETALQGALAVLHSGNKGDITINNLNGNLVCTSDAAHINIAALYGQHHKIATRLGNVSVKNLHSDSEIRILEEGHVAINSFDGAKLNCIVTRGNIDIFLTRHSDVSLLTKSGDINVKLNEENKSTFVASGDRVNVADELNISHKSENPGFVKEYVVGSTNGDIASEKSSVINSSIRAATNQGSINLLVESWIQSMGMRFKE